MRGPESRPATCSVICRRSSVSGPIIRCAPSGAMTDQVLASLSPRFTKMYSDIGRPSIPPEQLLRALLLQALYTIRSERLLMEEIDYSVLFRWFIGLSMDDPIWSPTTFSKNRDRLLESDIASAFFDARARSGARRGSDVRRTLHRRRHLAGSLGESEEFPAQGCRPAPPPDDPGNPTVNFHGESRSNDTHQSTTDPDAQLARKGRGSEAKLSYLGPCAARQSPRAGGQCLCDGRHGHGGT